LEQDSFPFSTGLIAISKLSGAVLFRSTALARVAFLLTSDTIQAPIVSNSSIAKTERKCKSQVLVFLGRQRTKKQRKIVTNLLFFEGAIRLAGFLPLL
jgi:hypothetical protein